MSETSIDYVRGEKICTIFSNDITFMNKMQNLVDSYPDVVKIKWDYRTEEGGGFEIVCPSKWFKIPKHPKIISDEQREAAKLRLQNARNNK
jgi:hypothetical protein